MYHTALLRTPLKVVFQVPSAWKEETVHVHPSTRCWQMLSRFQWWQAYIFYTVKCLAWHQIGTMLSTFYPALDQPFGPVMSCSLDLWLLFSYWLAGTMFCSDDVVIESTISCHKCWRLSVGSHQYPDFLEDRRMHSIMRYTCFRSKLRCNKFTFKDTFIVM